jgi:hypothetical protein
MMVILYRQQECTFQKCYKQVASVHSTDIQCTLGYTRPVQQPVLLLLQLQAKH